MVESRWLRRIGPGVVALGAVGFIASTALGVGARPWTPRSCAGPPGDRIAAARDPGPAGVEDLRGTPWFRLDPALDGDGALRSQRLALGLAGERTARTLELGAESFAAGPFGRLILAGSDDGFASRVQAIDVAGGCTWAIAEEDAVIRRATIDPTAGAMYEMRVDRASRADLGIWRRPLDGLTPAIRVLPPIAQDGRFGRTFATEFTWDLEGDRLAVQSCGESACRTRVVAPHGGSAALLDDPDLGPVIGFVGDRLVSYLSCRGLPCPIVSTDLGSGQRRVLAETPGVAIVVATTDGARLVHEVGVGSTRTLRSVALDGGAVADLGPIPDDLALHPSQVQAAAATRTPVGWVLLAPAGRLAVDDVSNRSQLRHVPDGTTVQLEEAVR
jgi:hypothetical protein